MNPANNELSSEAVGHLMNHKTRARALWEAFENTLGESA